jgi:hypothetical protein
MGGLLVHGFRMRTNFSQLYQLQHRKKLDTTHSKEKMSKKAAKEFLPS